MSQTINTSLGALRVDVTGSGPAALLWHSLFLDNQQWDRIAPDLAGARRLVAIEGPGHGGSDMTVSTATLEDCATAALQVMDALDISEADWLGNAWGGHVGIVAAAHHPERITSLVTIGSPLVPLPASERKHLQVAVWLYKAFGPRQFLTNAVLKTLLTPAVRTNDPGAVEAVRRAFAGADRKALGSVLDTMMLGRPDLVSTYNALSTPRLMIVGAEDHVWSSTVANEVTEQSSMSTITTIPEASHIPPLEQPQATSTAILQFWDQSVGSTAHEPQESAEAAILPVMSAVS